MIFRPETARATETPSRGTGSRPAVAIAVVLACVPIVSLAGITVAAGAAVTAVAILLRVRIMVSLVTGALTASVIYLLFGLMLGVV